MFCPTIWKNTNLDHTRKYQSAEKHSSKVLTKIPPSRSTTLLSINSIDIKPTTIFTIRSKTWLLYKDCFYTAALSALAINDDFVKTKVHTEVILTNQMLWITKTVHLATQHVINTFRWPQWLKFLTSWRCLPTRRNIKLDTVVFIIIQPLVIISNLIRVLIFRFSSENFCPQAFFRVSSPIWNLISLWSDNSRSPTQEGKVNR